MLKDFVSPDFYPASAELFIVAMTMVILLADLAFGKTQRWVAAALSQITLISAAVIIATTTDGQTTLTFSNMFLDDALADFLKVLTCGAVIMTLVYSRDYLARRKLDSGEFYLLVLYATLGMMVMISASHFVTLYIGLELMSLSLYGLVALDRDSARGTEAAMKYFVLGALASGLLLYGMSMLYGATGTLEIGGVVQSLMRGNVPHHIAVFGLVFTVAGIAFKLGVVPFHMWIPDVYQGAPTPVTLFIASAPKLAAFAMMLRLLFFGLFPLALEWQQMLLFLALLSMALGNLAAIAQTNIKRMLAYSAIAHMGFMLLGVANGVIGGQIDPFALTAAYGSSLYYVVAYVLMSAGAFAVVLLLSRLGHEAEELADFKGLNKRSPWFAAMMAVMMFSMAGIPFFVGFFAKFSVLVTVVKAGFVQVAVIAVILSLIGAFYYLRVVKYMYFDPPADDAAIVAPLDFRVLLTINGLTVALLGMFPNWLIEYCLTTVMRSL